MNKKNNDIKNNDIKNNDIKNNDIKNNDIKKWYKKIMIFLNYLIKKIFKLFNKKDF